MEHLIKEKAKLMRMELRRMIRTTWTPNDVLVYKDHAEIYLRNKTQELVGITTIDREDVEKIKKYKWHLHPKGYCGSQSTGKETKLHRLLINAKQGQIVDHMDINPLNNRKKNLRIVDDSTSLRNRRKREIVPIIVSESVRKIAVKK